MKKIGLILDSTSGMNSKELDKYGVAFIPTMISIDGEDFEANNQITNAKIFSAQNKNEILRTSSPTPKKIMEAFDSILEKNEKAIYVGVSGGMSSTNGLIQKMSEEEKYKGKIFVFKSNINVFKW